MKNATGSWESAFRALDQIEKFSPNHLGIFALALRFKLDDLESVGTEANIDGKNDKKCDLLFIDEDRSIAVMIQCYIATGKRKSAPSNKGAGLNTSLTWFLQRPLEELHLSIRPHAERLRDGIRSGQIKQLHIWYVHNLKESSPVAVEMAAVHETASALLSHNFGTETPVQVFSREIGQNTLTEWYREIQSPILIDDKIDLSLQNGFVLSGEDWSALVTTVPASVIQDWYSRYKEKLFSANIRDYLGSKETDSNINNGIKQTVREEPQNFWAYNNGLTILVNNFSYDEQAKRAEIDGVSIVNGAQTTGSLGSVAAPIGEMALVSVRFIKTSKDAILSNLIRYNNSQNKVNASDFRSTDAVQRKLREEMRDIPRAEYDGGRRGGASDSIRRRTNALPSMTVGQAVAAVHGDPTVAYNKKSDIWDDSALYSKYFCEKTTAMHVVFCFSLLRCIEARKASLIEKSKNDKEQMTQTEIDQLGFLRERGALFLLVSAVSECLEIILNRKVSDKFSLSFGKVAPDEAIGYWGPIINVCLPLSNQLNPAFSNGLQSQQLVREALKNFRGVIGAIAESTRGVFDEFAKKVI